MSTFGTTRTPTDLPPPNTIIHVGAGAPDDAFGDVGEFYYNTSDGTLYGPKLASDGYSRNIKAYVMPGAAGNTSSAEAFGQVVNVLVAGQIAGARFWKKVEDGYLTHAMRLYNGSTGALLASATTPPELTVPGWQEAYFDTPVSVAAGTILLPTYDWPTTATAAYYNSLPGSTAPSQITYGNAMHGTLGAKPIYTYANQQLYVDIIFRTPASGLWPAAIASP